MIELYKPSLFGLIPALLLSCTQPVEAATTLILDSIPSGIATFDAIGESPGYSLTTDTWNDFSGDLIDFGAYTVARADGGTINSFWDGNNYQSITGYVTQIGTGGVSEPKPGFDRGIVFTFDEAINGFGIELGDWGTGFGSEIYPSNIYVSFDGGVPILLAAFDGTQHTALTNGFPEVFVAAFDSAGSFTQVRLWNDGVEEYVTAGGTIRYTRSGLGPVEPEPVPLPASLWGLVAGICAIAGMAKHRAKRNTT